MNSGGIDRREFIKRAGMGAVGATLTVNAAGSLIDGPPAADTAAPSQKPAKVKPAVEFRILGKTGLKVSAVSYGAMRTRESEVIRYAIDKGINYLDTAHCYMNGDNEKIVARALKGRRNKVYIATKVHIAPKQQMIESVQDSLKSLQTDYIDVVQLHGMSNAQQPQNAEAIEAMTAMKKKGLVRFCGVSTHKNQAEVIRGMIETKFYDIVMMSYNFKSPAAIKEAVARAAKAGLGVVAMKTQAGGYKEKKLGNLSPHAAALKYILQDKNVHTTIPSMPAFNMVDENMQAMTGSLTFFDRRTLGLYGAAIANRLCLMCGRCEGTCEQGVDIQEALRHLMYYEAYGERQLAQSGYRQIPAAQSAEACFDCRKCSARCANGLKIKQQLVRAHRLLA